MGTWEKAELKSRFQKQGSDRKLGPGTASLSAKRAGGISLSEVENILEILSPLEPHKKKLHHIGLLSVTL